MDGLLATLEKCVSYGVIDKSVKERILLELYPGVSHREVTQVSITSGKNGKPRVTDSLLSLQSKVKQATGYMKMRNALDQIKIRRRDQLTEQSAKYQALVLSTPLRAHSKTSSLGNPSDGNQVDGWDSLNSPAKSALKEQLEQARREYERLLEENDVLCRQNSPGNDALPARLTEEDLAKLTKVKNRYKSQLEQEVAQLSDQLHSLQLLHSSDKYQVMRLQRKLSEKAVERMAAVSQFNQGVRMQNLVREAQKHQSVERKNATAESKLEEVERLSQHVKQTLQAKLDQLRSENEAIESLLESPVGQDIRGVKLQEAQRRRYLHAEIQVLQKALLQKLETDNRAAEAVDSFVEQPPVHRDSKASTLRREFNLQKKASVSSPLKADWEETAVSAGLKKNVHLYKCCHA